MKYTIGLDYGTNSVRCLIVDVASGAEVGTVVHEYETGEASIIPDSTEVMIGARDGRDFAQETREHTRWERFKSWMSRMLPWLESSKGLATAYAKAKVAKERNEAGEIAAKRDLEREMHRILDQKEIREFNVAVDDICAKDGLSPGAKMLKLAKLIEKNRQVVAQLDKAKQIAEELALWGLAKIYGT